MLRDDFNLNGVLGTMHRVVPLMIVNGPYTQQRGLRGGHGCFGPGFRVNASMGRAIRLVLLNLGGGLPGVASPGDGSPGADVSPGSGPGSRKALAQELPCRARPEAEGRSRQACVSCRSMSQG
jgi:hypothetical protein